jgi:hypothetical protein
MFHVGEPRFSIFVQYNIYFCETQDVFDILVKIYFHRYQKIHPSKFPDKKYGIPLNSAGGYGIIGPTTEMLTQNKGRNSV